MLTKNKNVLILSCLIAALSLTGCAGSAGSAASAQTAETPAAETSTTDASSETADSTASESEPLSIVCTIFPEYDWVREILGDHAQNAEITYLLQNGVDLHSYQPTAEDMMKIAECDLFIYVGGESDAWVENTLSAAENPDRQVINLLEVLGDSAKVEERKEGMQESEHEHDHEHSKTVSTFEDDEVQDRPLSDWEGDWQSAYPLVLDGSLDEAWEHKSEDGSMTVEEYKDYYTKGYKSDYAAISIHDDHIQFTDNDGNVTESDYKYTGYFIQNWSTGTKAAMYRFEAEDKASGAPIYIEFNDHIIEPEKAEHFHIRMSNESYDAIVDPEGNWPTFFDASLSPKGVCEEVIGHDHKDEDEDEEHEHEEGEVEYDEHVWLSLKHAKVLCAEIADKLGILDAVNAEDYKANLTAYTEKLDALDSDFQTLVDSASVKTVVFGDRFPFRYFVDDYGLDYFAAFVGCSAETEASFETITFLSQKVDELGVSTVFTLENSDQKIAQTVVENTKAQNQQIAALNSLQSVNTQQVESGATYLSIMQENYNTLKEALQS